MNNQNPLIPDDRQVSVVQVNEATRYLNEYKERPKKRSEFICIGAGHKTREFIKHMGDNDRLLPIPLFVDNKELREQIKPREKSPLFRVIAASLASKAKNLGEEIKQARKPYTRQEYPILYRLEPPMDGEKIYDALTHQEYLVYCQDEGETKM